MEHILEVEAWAAAKRAPEIQRDMKRWCDHHDIQAYQRLLDTWMWHGDPRNHWRSHDDF